MYTDSILVVEDDVLSRNMIERRLKKSGFSVATSSSAAEGWKILNSGNFDLILLDINLPDKSGLELIREIRSQWLADQLPVIFVSGMVDSDDVVTGLRAGANDYVTKPINYQVLLARCITNLRARRSYALLEQRVLERTSDLHKLNSALEVRIKEKEAIEKVLLEKQEQLVQAEKMASLGILVSGVAHEINNPNHVVHSSASTLQAIWSDAFYAIEQHGSENPEFQAGGLDIENLRTYVPQLNDALLRASQRIKRIVRELRDFSQTTVASEVSTVNLNDISESAITLTSTLIKKSTSRFLVQFDQEGVYLRGNYHRLEQVIINVLQNACHALTSTNQGIKLKTCKDMQKKLGILELIDEGLGIPEENQKLITNPFFTTKREQGGTGLGLSISSSIIYEHGGDIHFESVPGKETVVRIEFPLDDTRITREGLE